MEGLEERRRKRLWMREIGLATPASYVSYAPFDEPKYPHKARLNLSKEPWAGMTALKPDELLSPNPFARSKLRDGWAVWDSAAIPQTAGSEAAGTLVGGKISPLTAENPFAARLESEYMSMVGTNAFGQPMRPAGQYMFDLTRMGHHGWLLAETAHALAHLRCDGLADLETGAFRHIIQKSMCEALASLLQGILWSVPVYVGPDNVSGRSPVWPATGISTAPFDFPTMRVPREFGCPEPDSVCVQALYLFHVEPVPESYVSKTVGRKPNDEWSGFPTLMAFAGWDGIDSVLHARVQVSPKSGKTSNVMHVSDLIEPELFKEAVGLAASSGVPGQLNDEWVMPWDWIGSQSWLELVSKTPPMPCRDCYMVNQRTPGAPVLRGTGKKMVDAYEAARDECIATAAKAAVPFETECYLLAKLKRPSRDARVRANRKRFSAAKREKAERARREAVRRKLSGKSKTPLTEGQRKLLERMKKEGDL